MNRFALGAALLAGVFAPLASADPSAEPSKAGDRDGYRGFITIGAGPTHQATQGAAWTTVFKEKQSGRVRYRVCLKHRDPPKVKRCWSDRTRRSGRSSVFVALFVNDVGGPGDWRARWKVGGKNVETWNFTARPEGV